MQTFERRGRVLDWDSFCSAVLERFDRDQYHIHLRQLDSLRQTGSVTAYLERFEELSHGVLLYNDQYDDTYFVTRFLGGLTEDIRSAIALHQPTNVQEANALALLQEEELAHSSKRGSSREHGKFSSRNFVQSDKPKFSTQDKSEKQSLHRKGTNRLLMIS